MLGRTKNVLLDNIKYLTIVEQVSHQSVFMPICKKQLHRLIMLVARLKQNLYPNCSSFVNELRKCDLYENKNVLCSPKTIQRDIQTLISEFGAPIQFDKSKNGYYLADNTWNFLYPVIDDEEHIAETIVALKSLENTFPCTTSITSIIDNIIATNKADNSGNSIFDSLIISNSKQSKVNPVVFKNVIDAWYKRHCLQIEIDNQSYTLEPHVLACIDNEWIVAGLIDGKTHNLALSSITSASVINIKFKIVNKILANVKLAIGENGETPNSSLSI